MKIGGQIPWNFTPICEIFKISHLMGRRPREFVVDSGASMHMTSKKDLSDAEMDTLTKSCSRTIVITANGEVQTHEEGTVHVKELDFF